MSFEFVRKFRLVYSLRLVWKHSPHQLGEYRNVDVVRKVQDLSLRSLRFLIQKARQSLIMTVESRGFVAQAGPDKYQGCSHLSPIHMLPFQPPTLVCWCRPRFGINGNHQTFDQRSMLRLVVTIQETDNLIDTVEDKIRICGFSLFISSCGICSCHFEMTR